MLHLLAQTYNYTYSIPSNTKDEATGLGIFAALFGTYMLFVLAFVVIALVGLWRVFEKAGRPGWHALIPVYNFWVLAELAGKPGWWSLVSLGAVVPFFGFFAAMASFVLYIIIALELVKRFGKDTTFAALLILLPSIGFIILGFGDAKYAKPKVVSAKKK